MIEDWSQFEFLNVYNKFIYILRYLIALIILLVVDDLIPYIYRIVFVKKYYYNINMICQKYTLDNITHLYIM